ncbi:hypothetical protein L484_017283 [Morus notabilis]|uniref:Uncharacterized protein n=1 Tax=Morus notabilis TaxID=981085 RepID=W9SHA4_9ROSA|nr:hypothetical protein L484_017283 [Morus notabilis]
MVTELGSPILQCDSEEGEGAKITVTRSASLFHSQDRRSARSKTPTRTRYEFSQSVSSSSLVRSKQRVQERRPKFGEERNVERGERETGEESQRERERCLKIREERDATGG